MADRGGVDCDPGGLALARAVGQREGEPLEQACQWSDGWNRGAFRLVPMPDGRELNLCLRHAGRVWNGRKSANRAAADKRRSRNYARLAAQCGIELPRQAGRRRAFVAVYCEAFKRS